MDEERSFLDSALKYASLETRHHVADALACHLHNTGQGLAGNTEANDVEWFARRIFMAEGDGSRANWHWDVSERKDDYRQIARTVIRALPEFQLRVAHRLIELSKVTRDISEAARKEHEAARRRRAD